MSASEPRLRDAQARAVAALPATTLPASATAQDGGALAYAGLATRAIAFALDAAVVNGVAMLVTVVVGLGLSLLHLSESAEIALVAIGGAIWVLWSIAYFVFFWSTSGQTPGDRLMRIQVLDGRNRRPPRPVRSLVRFGGLILAALPLLAGFLIMLWDRRRRCLQDRIAHTVVVDLAAAEAAAAAAAAAAMSVPDARAAAARRHARAR